ncbi:hypothetical protein PR048_032948 [Dryococelus australis]|uniref:Integrase catalytic domain-containing protein n=1 Tax=Dryococelus australis TaxID=614101 RepID=A0ABQ9G6H9_9NEOP|nr:hypothetical protein PR048_032948 [Dryococelus australis]
MNQYISKYVKECNNCQLAKHPLNSKVGNYSVELPIGGLSKFTILLPLRDMKAGNISKVLIDRVRKIFGSPKLLISDNASNFNSSIIKDAGIRVGGGTTGSDEVVTCPLHSPGVGSSPGPSPPSFLILVSPSIEKWSVSGALDRSTTLATGDGFHQQATLTSIPKNAQPGSTLVNYINEQIFTDELMPAEHENNTPSEHIALPIELDFEMDRNDNMALENGSTSWNLVINEQRLELANAWLWPEKVKENTVTHNQRLCNPVYLSRIGPTPCEKSQTLRKTLANQAINLKQHSYALHHNR